MLATCLVLAGCGKQDNTSREVLTKLDSLKSELTAHQGQPVRWATASKRQIESAISEWTRIKTDEANNSETLTPEQREQIRSYEALSSELMQKRMAQRRFPGMMPPGDPINPEADKDYQALSQKVEAAKAPIADLLERRSRLYSQLNDRYKPETLIAEYAKNRFDLVIDVSEMSFNRSSVLFSRSGEALDITDGVIQLFKAKTAK